MSTKGLTNPPDKGPEPITLAEVRRRILADPTLSLGQRRDIASSLNTLGKAAGRMLEAILASPPVIRDLIQHKTAAMVGASRGRWNNVRSHTCLAMLQVGLVVIPNRINAPPSEAWRALLGRVSGTGPSAVLGRFARCCTRIGIEPPQVDDAFMAGHRADLIHRSLISDPETNFRETVLAWNSAVMDVEGWPSARLTVPDNSLYYTPPWSTYPPTLIADIDRWLAGSVSSDIFVRLERSRPLRPATIESNRVHLRLLVGALVNTGEDPSSLVDLAAVITPDRVKRSCLYHLDRASGQRNYVAARISGIAVAIGTHCLKLEVAELKALQDMARELRMPKRGMTDRNKARLRAMGDAGRTEALINLPLDMAAEVDRDVRRICSSTPILALKYQTALVLELALTKSWRIRNLGGLIIGKNLFLRPDGRVVASLDGSEVKNGQSIETTFSPRLAGMVHTYLDLHISHLTDGPSDFLFPGTGTGRAKTLGALSQNIKAALNGRVGIEATSHFFRHFSAKLILNNDPTAIRFVQERLGHQNAQSLKYYVESGGPAASAYVDGMIDDRRSQARPPKASSSKAARRAAPRKGRK